MSWGPGIGYQRTVLNERDENKLIKGDIFEIEACATIYMPASAITAAGYTALSGNDPNALCNRINAQMQMLDIVDILGAQAGVKSK